MTDDDRPSRRVVLRDVLIFQLKLWLDGLKDVFLSPLSIGAAVLDVLFHKGLFYRVLRLGERFDLWLNLYGRAKEADKRRTGLMWEHLRPENTFPPDAQGQTRDQTQGEALPSPPDADASSSASAAGGRPVRSQATSSRSGGGSE